MNDKTKKVIAGITTGAVLFTGGIFAGDIVEAEKDTIIKSFEVDKVKQEAKIIENKEEEITMTKEEINEYLERLQNNLINVTERQNNCVADHQKTIDDINARITQLQNILDSFDESVKINKNLLNF